MRSMPISAGCRCRSCHGPGALDVTLPTDANLMPPGYYMLFLLDTSGVPSVSRMLKVTSVAAPPDTVPPTAPSGLNATAAGSSITVNWTAATDNVGVTGYQLERCQGPSCNNFAFVATLTGTDVSRSRAPGVDRLPVPRTRHRWRRQSERVFKHCLSHHRLGAARARRGVCVR